MGELLKTIIHVNKHIIASNRIHNENKPALTVKTYKENRKGFEALIKVEGRVVGRFIHSPEKPLPCGARVWFETTEEVDVITTV